MFQGVLQGERFARLCESLTAWYDEQEVSQRAANYLMSWLDRGLVSRIVVESS